MKIKRWDTVHWLRDIFYLRLPFRDGIYVQCADFFVAQVIFQNEF